MRVTEAMHVDCLDAHSGAAVAPVTGANALTGVFFTVAPLIEGEVLATHSDQCRSVQARVSMDIGTRLGCDCCRIRRSNKVDGYQVVNVERHCSSWFGRYRDDDGGGGGGYLWRPLNVELEMLCNAGERLRGFGKSSSSEENMVQPGR